MDGSYYQNQPKRTQSLTDWMASALYNNTLGFFFQSENKEENNLNKAKISENSDIVNIEFLKRQSEVVLRWAAKLEKEIFSEKQLRRSIRDSKVREEDIDLIIQHLERTNKLAISEVKISNQITRLLKLGTIKGPPPEISQKETATFALEENIVSIEQKVSELQIKVQKLKSQIQQALKNGMKDHAKFLLLKKKNLEKFWQKLEGHKHLLEDNLMNIEEIENQTVIFEALKYAESAGTSISKEIGDYENLLDKIDEQKTQNQKINMLIQDSAGMSQDQESELLKELEELEASQVFAQLHNIEKKPIGQKKVDMGEETRKLEEQLQELEMNPSEMTATSSPQRRVKLNEMQEEEKSAVLA